MMQIGLKWCSWIRPEWIAGYKTDQSGIMRRYLREQANWEPHLEHCKRIMLEFLNPLLGGHVLILGSGWLLDVPVNEILKRGFKVTLVDIYHPVQILHRYKNQQNLQFIKVDITGGLIKTAVQSNNLEHFLAQAADLEKPFDVSEYDAIISINLLNQLDIILCDYLKKRFKVSDSALDEIRKMVQSSHLKWLSTQNTLIVSDTVESVQNPEGTIVLNKPIVHVPFADYRLLDEWDWFFDSHQRYNPSGNTVFKVQAYTTRT